MRTWRTRPSPVPAGLRELSDSLASVAQFLKIDDDLIAVAAKAGAPLVSVSDDGIVDWVTALSASEKDKFLTMVAEGEGAQVEALLVRRFRRESRPAGTTPASTGRTAGELLAAAEARRAPREQAEARAKEEARARRAAEQAAAYERHLKKPDGTQGGDMAAGSGADRVLQAERMTRPHSSCATCT
jgi:hypothetical protein